MVGIRLDATRDNETEVLILGNVLVILGGIAGAAGFVAGWAGIGLAFIGTALFVLGLHWLWTSFKFHQLPLLKDNVAMVKAMVESRVAR